MLVTPYSSGAHDGSEIRIFAVALCHTSPTGIMRHIDHGRECPADTILVRLFRSSLRGLFNQFGIECSALSQRNGIDGLEAVNDITRSHQRNAETCLLHRHPLQAVHFFRSDDIEDRTHLSFADKRLFLFGIPGRVELVHLSDLLLQRHA